jgi:hypothetical protein
MLEDVSKRQNLGEQNEQAYRPILPFFPNRSITTKRAKDILHLMLQVFGGDTRGHTGSMFKTIINSPLYEGFNLGLSGKGVSKGCLVCTAM